MLNSRDMRAEKDAKDGERVQQVEASRTKQAHSDDCPSSLESPSTTTTSPSTIPSQWSPPGKPLVSGEDPHQPHDIREL